MIFSWLEWKNTPWGKATGGQWRYALRNSIAMILSLLIAFEFQMDEPYWALTSAAVVSFPTVGGVISKSIGRIIGSLLGSNALAGSSVTGATGDAANYSNLLLIAAGTALLGLIVFFVFKKKIYEGNHALETEESAK